MKKSILIKWWWFASIILYELLNHFWYKVDLEIWNKVFVETFISLTFFNKINFLFKGIKFEKYNWYYFVDWKLEYWWELIFLWKTFFDNYKSTKKEDLFYDYEFKWNWIEESEKDILHFWKLKVFKLRINNFKKNFSLEFYDEQWIPSYFYHIWEDDYIFWYYTFSNNGITYLNSTILKTTLFDDFNTYNIEYIDNGKVYNIDYQLIKKNNFNNFNIWNNIWFLPPFLWIWNKLVFTDALFILDFLNKWYKKETLFKNLFNYRRAFYDNSQVIWEYIKNNWNINYWKIQKVSNKLNNNLDKIINFFIK